MLAYPNLLVGIQVMFSQAGSFYTYNLRFPNIYQHFHSISKIKCFKYIYVSMIHQCPLFTNLMTIFLHKVLTPMHSFILIKSVFLFKSSKPNLEIIMQHEGYILLITLKIMPTILRFWILTAVVKKRNSQWNDSHHHENCEHFAVTL